MDTKGILFDFNGTMFYDEVFQNASWKTFLESKLKRAVTDEEMQNYVHGRNAEATFAYFFQREVSRDETAALEEEKEVIYRSLCLANPEKFHLAEGLPQFLDELKKQSIPFTIATASGFPNVKFFFEHFPLARWFDPDKVICNDGTFPGKPEPDIYLKAAEKIGIDIHKCVVFEDARSGITAAYRAGAKKVIGVASMLDAEELLSIDGVSSAIRDYQDLPDLLQKIF